MKSLALGRGMMVWALLIAALGCQPTPVVVNPDADGDTAVIEERDIEVNRQDEATPPQASGTDVKVEVGGGKGIDVDVNRKGAEDSK